MNKDGVRKKKKKAKKVFGKILISLTVVFMLAAATAIYFEQESHMERISERNKELSEIAEQARENRDEARELLEKSGTLEYIEKVAREQLGMVMPGEIIFTD